jgi:transcriptional regulator with XRE-family HTH domain
MMTKDDLKIARKMMGITQAELAEMAGVHMQTAARWENKELPKHGVSRMFISNFIRDAKKQCAPSSAPQQGA